MQFAVVLMVCCGLDPPVPVPQRLGVHQSQAACKEVGGLGCRGVLQGTRAVVTFLPCLADGHQLKQQQWAQGRTPIVLHTPGRGCGCGYYYQGWDLFYFYVLG